MQGKGGDNIIRIGVAPGTGRGRIIDWQKLDDLHTCSLRPVDQQPKIAEVPHPTGMAATEREHRHCNTRSPPDILLDTQALTIDHQHRTVRDSRLFWRKHALDATVVAFLPGHKGMGGIIDNHELIFQRQQNGIDIHGQLPVAEANGLHAKIACRIPAA